MNAVAPKNLSQWKGIPIPVISLHFFLVESEKRLKESGIPLTIGVRNPNSTDKKSGFQYLEFEFTAWNPESETALDSLAWRDRSIFNLHDNKAKNDHKRVAHYD